MTDADVKVDQGWRRFAWLLGIGFVSAVLVIGSVSVASLRGQASSSAENDRLRAQVDLLSGQLATNTRQSECRSRIVNAAEVIRGARDSIGWQALVERVAEADDSPEARAAQARVLFERARQMTDLNERLSDAIDLRAQSIRICADNPDFVPPT
jgi:hypothetical protein